MNKRLCSLLQLWLLLPILMVVLPCSAVESSSSERAKNSAAAGSVLEHKVSVADSIAHATRVHLYNLDKSSLRESLRYIFSAHPEIVAVKIRENELNEVFFRYYRDDTGEHFDQALPQSVYGHVYSKTPIDYRGEPLGFVELYVDRASFKQSGSVYSQRESEFLSTNPVLTIGVEQTAPLVMRDETGQLNGILIDYLTDLFDNTPITVQYRVDTFSNVLQDLKEGQVDVVAGVYYHPSRESLGNFSLPFMSLRDYLYARVDDDSINSIDSLKGKTLAIVDSYLSIELIKNQYPDITIRATRNLEESADLVLSGQADALLDAQLFVSFLQGHKSIAGLKGMPQSIIPSQSLHILSAANNAEINSIIKKLQANTTSVNDSALVSRFLGAGQSLSESGTEDSYDDFMPLLFLLIALVCLFSLIAVVVRRASSDEKLDFDFSSHGFERFLILTIALFATFIVACSWYLLSMYRADVDQQTYRNLLQSLNTAEGKVDGSFDFYLEILGHEYNQPLLVQSIIGLSQTEDKADREKYRTTVLEYWKQYQYFSKKQARQLVRADGTTLIGPEKFGAPNKLANKFPLFLEFSLKGETIIQPSQECPTSSYAYSENCVLVFRPISDEAGSVRAVVIDQLYLNMHFFDQVKGLGAGLLGTVYPVDWRGNVLFNKGEGEVHQAVAFEKDNNPLVSLVSATPDGERALSLVLSRYTNYEGEEVFGIFSWNPKYNFGLVSELKVDEGLASYSRFRYSIVIIILLMLLFTVPSILFTLKMGRRANKNLQLSKDQLSELVDVRTQELSHLEENSRLILSSIGQGLIGTNADFDVIYANGAALKLLKYSEDEIIGMNFFDFLQMKKSDNFGRIVEALYKSTGYSSEDETFIRSDGTVFSAQCNCQSMKKDYELRGSVIVFGDISDRIQLQEDLMIARDTAEKASHAKGEFLANMSHEIRTPMNAVIGMAYLALQTDLKPKQRNYIQKSHNSALLLLGIIDDILDFSKIEAGKLNLETTPFDLEFVLNNVAESIGLKAREKELEFMFDLSPCLPKTVIGDPLRLSQIIMNLANNAVKFTHDGEITIHVQPCEAPENISLLEDVRPDKDDDIYIQLSVKDTGIGLSEQQQAKLFKSFNQADSSTTREYGGTGLGLAISKQLSTLMHGCIWVESTLGDGAEFFVKLRLTVGEDVPRVSSYTGPIAFGHVLIVDDNENTLEIMAVMCKAIGLTVSRASSGEAALAYMAECQSGSLGIPDLLLLDWKMPGMDGIDTALAIREQLEEASMPKIIMATVFSPEEVEAEVERRCSGLVQAYLCKPISYLSLGAAMAKAGGPVQEANEQGGAHDDTRDGNDDGRDASVLKESLSALRGAKILLVEDNDVNRELAEELLRSNGMRVDVATNGVEAVEKVVNGSFDGVLMDCQMPVMDGYQATRMLREKGFHDLPILAMTANALLSDKEKAKAAGMNEHIAKPIDVNDLFSKMAQWISPSEKADASTEHSGTQQDQHHEDVIDWGFLKTIPHVDSEQGMATCQHNYGLYLRLLRKFSVVKGGFVEQIEAALAVKDSETCRLLVHSLKGSAGNVGAFELHRAATDLERDVNERGLEADYQRCLQLAQTQIKAIREVIEGHNEIVHQDVEIQKKDLVDALARMMELFRHDDTRAQDLFRDIKPHLQSLFDDKYALEQLEQAVDSYDFDTAAELLRSLNSTLT